MDNQPQILTGEVLPPLKDLVPRDYQEWSYNAIARAIRDYQGPFFIEASVGAGKTAIMAMILSQAQEKGIPCMVLARRGELVEQNSETFWAAGVRNSIFSASMGIKSTKYQIIVGSEGTVARSLETQLRHKNDDGSVHYQPAILIIDECLTGDTMITTANGQMRIDDPDLINQEIACVDETCLLRDFHKPVRVFSNGTKSIWRITTECGNQIKCTANHKLFSYSPFLGGNASWVPASSLSTGEELYTHQLGWRVIASIEKDIGYEEVFDIEMPTHHNFFANGILVHNCHEVGFDQEDSQYMKIIAELLARQPKLRIIGLTGSPYRGTKDILGEFWKSCVYRVRTPYLVDRGFLVPTIFGFGHDDVQYDLSNFKIDPEDNHADYTKEDLLAMQRVVTEDKTTTQRIIAEVIELTKNRNTVMITGAGKKHLEQIAECLPEDSWIIITDDTGNKERRFGLKQAYDGKKKFILQIGCLTTGVDIPLIDTSVIMRKIGSLTLLVQLLGRGMRLLKPFQKEAGYFKEDHLVLDYSGTMDEMAEMYADPVLERATHDKAIQEEVDMVICGLCQQKNSPRARRCIGRIDPDASLTLMPVVRTDKDGKQWRNFEMDGRCENFYHMRECMVCGTPNDTAARECRKCEAILIDPNKNLSHKHYVDADFRPVFSWTMGLTRNGQGIVVTYFLDGVFSEDAKKFNFRGKDCEMATELLFPEAKEKWMKSKWFDFLNTHVKKEHRGYFRGKKAIDCIKMMKYMQIPTHITHRVNSEKRSVIHRKRFGQAEVTSIDTGEETTDSQNLLETNYE